MRHAVGRRLVATTALLALTAAACGGDDEPELASSEEPTEAATSEEEPTESEPETTETELGAVSTTAEEPADFSTTAEEPAGGLGTTAEEPTSAPVEPPPPVLGEVPALLLGGEPQELEDLCRVDEVIVANYVFEASVEFTPFGTSSVGVRAFTDGSDIVTYGTQTTTDDAVVLEGTFTDGAFPDVELQLDPGEALPACPFEYEPTPVPPPD